MENEIRELLEETRQRARFYGSAHYGPGETGLGLRLDAIEEALTRLARSIDEISAGGGHREGE